MFILQFWVYMLRSFPPLNTTQVLHLLNHRHGKHTLGVFSLDQLPSNPPRGRKGAYCFIVNTDPAHLPGSHWLAVYVNLAKRTGQVFDSYGRPPPLTLQKWLTKNVRHWTYNKKYLQGPLTALCGLYCIYVLDRICSTDCAVKMITNYEFHDTSTMNDLMIYQYYKRYLQ